MYLDDLEVALYPVADYFTDEHTLVFVSSDYRVDVEVRFVLERYFEKHCGVFKVQVDFTYDKVAVSWGFEEETFRLRETWTPETPEPPVAAVVKKIEEILDRYGSVKAPQPVEEPDIVRLMEGIVARWSRWPVPGVTLHKGGAMDWLIWFAEDGTEVLSLVPSQVNGTWQVNVVDHHAETIDWSGVDVEAVRSALELAGWVVDRPRLPRLTTFVFCDQGTACSYAHDYWLREMPEHLWDTVEASLDMYSDHSR